MLVLIQFNEVKIFEGISKASVQLCRKTFEEHQRYSLTSTHTRHFGVIHSPIINLKVALQSFATASCRLIKPVSSFAIIFNLSYRNFIRIVRLSKDFTFLLSKDLPEDFHKSHNTHIFSKLTI